MSWSLFGRRWTIPDRSQEPEMADGTTPSRELGYIPVSARLKAPRTLSGSLAKQLAAALNAARKPDSPTVFAQRIGLPVLTVKRFCAGQAMKIQALEKLATGMGWTISITDKDGKEVVHL